VVELLEAWCLKSVEEVISLKLWATQARQLSGAVVMEKARNEVREVGGEKFGAEKKAKKTLGRERGCVLVHPQNDLKGLILN